MCRILIAEDEPALRNLIALATRRFGHEPDLVPNGQEAIERLRIHDYGVLVLDLMMPIINGYDVIEFVRGMRRRPAIIVVSAMDTAYLGLDPDVVTAIVRKPFDVELLGAVITQTAAGMARASGHRRSDLADTDLADDRPPS